MAKASSPRSRSKKKLQDVIESIPEVGESVIDAAEPDVDEESAGSKFVESAEAEADDESRAAERRRRPDGDDSPIDRETHEKYER
ncbi:MAG TPA: hypothetical protein PKC49_14100, partial [Phycisphaerae bacterium]|nr:hypothetical protein [Phycisphaerae bacterium]